jgi:hypothetical protein
MRATLIIDDALLERAREATGIQEKTALVRAGLEVLLSPTSLSRSVVYPSVCKRNWLVET